MVYNRTCSASDSVEALPYTILVGTEVDGARQGLANDLKAIAKNIERRDQTRILPWTILHPAHICASNLS
jgi:hypothetical protein